jgi:hypothetical protein
MHQCPKAAVFGSVLSPMPYVAFAFALANCLRVQPLKTTLGLCCCPALVQFSLFVLYCNPVLTVSLPIARNILYIISLMSLVGVSTVIGISAALGVAVVACIIAVAC